MSLPQVKIHQLKNVTGFTKGEILLIKKVGDTGFNTEYVKVVSSSRTNAGGDDDPDGLAGIYLLREVDIM